MEQNFHWIQRIQGIWEITEAWIRINLTVFSINYVSVAQS